MHLSYLENWDWAPFHSLRHITALEQLHALVPTPLPLYPLLAPYMGGRMLLPTAPSPT